MREEIRRERKKYIIKFSLNYNATRVYKYIGVERVLNLPTLKTPQIINITNAIKKALSL